MLKPAKNTFPPAPRLDHPDDEVASWNWRLGCWDVYHKPKNIGGYAFIAKLEGETEFFPSWKFSRHEGVS